jgi:S-adenosyl-L-methionine hydrolase (adenosine-forming)
MTIALLTDFGTTDSYVGVMKGVIATICSTAQIIDITHAINPQNIRQGAFTLLNAYRYFPSGTIFLTVVDPGVGSTRRPIALRAGEYFFVAPDNGLLSYMLLENALHQAVELNNPVYQLSAVSYTFHGRDIFAPAAAHLAAGIELSQLGTMIERPVALTEPRLKVEDFTLSGEVLHIDHFGNLVTSIGLMEWISNDKLHLKPRFGRQHEVVEVDAVAATAYISDHEIKSIVPSYSRTQPGDLLTMIGSSGHLEIAINQGNAAARLGAQVGDRVEVRIS